MISFLAFASCDSGKQKNDPVWSALPQVTNLESLKKTDFVVTLENPVAENKNIIYAPAFLFAWGKIKEELQFPIIIDGKNSSDFKLLNQSNSYQNSLTKQEYSATAELKDGAIIARAFFNKTLPFDTKFEALDEPIYFEKTKVSAFGMFYYTENAVKQTEILYYKDDSNFVLKLIPKDYNHEIILVKGIRNFQTLKDAIKLTNDLISKGKKEQIDGKLSWKYQITPEDVFAVPSIKFNIETHYKNLEGQSFQTSDKQNHSFEIAYQRTGFIFNENGAVVESEAIAMTDSIGVESIITHPKKMIFDQPFLIIIKRIDKANPYFVMKVANAELLMKK